MGPWLVNVTGRADLDMWLHGGPPDFRGTTIMIVRGDDSDIRAFLPNALDAAKIDEGRVVVWIKDPALFEEDEKKYLFGDDFSVIAAVLPGPGQVGRWITRDRLRLEDARFAFSGAEEKRG